MRLRSIIFWALSFFLIAIGGVGFYTWVLLTPQLGPLEPLDVDVHELRTAGRPGADVPDSWPVVAELLVAVQAETIRANGIDPSPFDISRLYEHDLDGEEWSRLIGPMRDAARLALFHALEAPDEDGTPDDIAFAQRVFDVLDDPEFSDHLDQLAAARWMHAPVVESAGTTLLPYLSDVRTLSQYLRVRLVRAWRVGDGEDVRRVCGAHATLVLLLTMQVSLVEYHVGLSEGERLITCIESLIERHPPATALAASVRAAVDPLHAVPHWKTCLAGDRLNHLGLINAMYTGEPGGDGRFLPVLGNRRLSQRVPPEPYTFEDRLEDLRASRKAPRRRELRQLIDAYAAEIESLGEPTVEEVESIQAGYVDRLTTMAPGCTALSLGGVMFDGFFNQSASETAEALQAFREHCVALDTALAP